MKCMLIRSQSGLHGATPDDQTTWAKFKRKLETMKPGAWLRLHEIRGATQDENGKIKRRSRMSSSMRLPLPKQLSYKDNSMSNIDCTSKFCKICQTETKRNVRNACLPCNARREAKYRTAHPEKVQALAVDRYAKNKAKIIAASSAWQFANPEKLKAKNAAWYLANKEKASVYNAAWMVANPEAVRVIKQNRRARKIAVGGRLSKNLAGRLFALQRGKCACCGKPLEDDYHLDHIMPLALGGANVDSNIQLLRRVCNLQKKATHPVEFMQRRGFLL